MAVFSNAWRIAQSFKAHKVIGKKGPIEVTNKSPETNPMEMEMCELPDKKLKITIIEMFSELR